MEYLALYRKYRPKTFDEISGQDFIVTTLKNIIKNNKISHSFLFIGPRGTGKTSTAKIFAKTINCLNPQEGVSCEHCEMCDLNNKNEDIDIIEMDAASNNGVDEIREIKNHISLMPTKSKYKIYIIDEVHMLSAGAFNALLKTLEEPPKHVIFILATTDAQKVPLTIKSRCQNFEFKLIPKKVIVERLKYICEKENIIAEDDALELIAEISKGGLRDALSLLDQLISYTNGNIKYENVVNLSGTINQNEIKKLIDYISNSNYLECFKKIDEYESSGKNFSLICEDLIKFLKNEIIENRNSKKLNKEKIMNFIINLNECINMMKTTNDKRIYFDLYILKCFDIQSNQTNVRNNIQELNDIVEDKKPVIKIKTSIEEIEEKNPKDDKDYTLYETLMKTRINNILLDANKNVLKNYIDSLKSLSSNIMNLDDLKLSNLLMESTVRAGSEKGILITVNNKKILNELYDNLFNVEILLNKLYNRDIKVCFLLDDYWLNERTNFIEKIKNKKLEYLSDENELNKIREINKKEKGEFDSLLEIGE